MRPSATEIAIKPPTCWIIAGPNGAGKTTFALDFLPRASCMHFINADLIAAGISPGPQMGATLRKAEAAWIASDFALSRDALLRLA